MAYSSARKFAKSRFDFHEFLAGNGGSIMKRIDDWDKVYKFYELLYSLHLTLKKNGLQTPTYTTVDWLGEYGIEKFHFVHGPPNSPTGISNEEINMKRLSALVAIAAIKLFNETGTLPTNIINALSGKFLRIPGEDVKESSPEKYRVLCLTYLANVTGVEYVACIYPEAATYACLCKKYNPELTGLNQYMANRNITEDQAIWGGLKRQKVADGLTKVDYETYVLQEEIVEGGSKKTRTDLWTERAMTHLQGLVKPLKKWQEAALQAQQVFDAMNNVEPLAKPKTFS